MSTDRDTTRVVRSWLEEGVAALPDRVLDAVLDQVPATPQRRSFWQARRFAHVNKFAPAAIAAAAVVVVAVVGYNLLPRDGGTGEPASPVPTTGQTAAPSAPASPGTSAAPGPQTVTLRPFDGPEGFGMCPKTEVAVDCVEDPRDNSMTFTLELPAGWAEVQAWVEPEDSPMGSELGAGLLITRGSWLYSEPCRPDETVNPDIEVGPTVDDFVEALDAHPKLDVSVPMLKEVGGYPGTSMRLTVPDDISTCEHYRPIEETMYAQGPGHIWDLWIVDVNGIRVVIQANQSRATTEEQRQELLAIVDSIRITP